MKTIYRLLLLLLSLHTPQVHATTCIAYLENNALALSETTAPPINDLYNRLQLRKASLQTTLQLIKDTVKKAEKEVSRASYDYSNLIVTGSDLNTAKALAIKALNDKKERLKTTHNFRAKVMTQLDYISDLIRDIQACGNNVDQETLEAINQRIIDFDHSI